MIEGRQRSSSSRTSETETRRALGSVQRIQLLLLQRIKTAFSSVGPPGSRRLAVLAADVQVEEGDDAGDGRGGVGQEVVIADREQEWAGDRAARRGRFGSRAAVRS